MQVSRKSSPEILGWVCPEDKVCISAYTRMSKKNIYWICQLLGWAIFILLQTIFFSFTNQLNLIDFLNYFLWYVFAILLTHSFRLVILKFKLIQLSLIKQFLAILSGSIALAIFFVILQFIVAKTTMGRQASFNSDDLLNSINFAFVFFVWSVIYFSYQYLENYKKAEIDNLRYKVAMNEIELNRLKSQLNPHFMFNAMNSIRALIQEDPEKAKNAVTMLSHILRTTLQMEKNKLIPLRDEINLVRDYLELEKIRFEQRLNFEVKIYENAWSVPVPTLMLQTLVENGIKHGISKLENGGRILVSAEIKNKELQIEIKNSGELNSNQSATDSGYGIKNTLQRLQLIYGEKSRFELFGNNGDVSCRLAIPVQIEA